MKIRGGTITGLSPWSGAEVSLLPFALLVWMLVATTCLRSQELPPRGLDTLLDTDPAIPSVEVKVRLPQALIPLWEQALRHEDIELSRKVAETIANASHRELVARLEHTIDELRELLNDGSRDRLVRLAAARAIIALDDRDSATLLLRAIDELGADAALAIDPALAEWKFSPAVRVWRERSRSSNSPQAQRILAIQSLVSMEDSASSDLFMQLARDASEPPPIRLEAARAAAFFVSEGQAQEAASVSAKGGLVNRLIAVTLLSGHQTAGGDTGNQLRRFAADDEPAVARVAVKTLVRLAPEQVRQMSDKLLARPDPALRQLAIQALAGEASQDHLPQLFSLLADLHPDVRHAARETLEQYAAQRPELRSAIIDAASETADGTDWRTLEQALRLLGALDHKPAWRRCLELVEHPRQELHTTAAWTLRELQVAETLEPLLEHATPLAEQCIEAIQTGTGLRAEEYDDHLSFIFQLFGLLRFQEAEPLLKQHIPYLITTDEPRSAAIWALGYLHENQPDPELVDLLIERLSDVDPSTPESDRVRRFSAISLGRMRAETALPALREFWAEDFVPCKWAIEHLTDETLELPSPEVVIHPYQFLTPLEHSSAPASQDP